MDARRLGRSQMMKHLTICVGLFCVMASSAFAALKKDEVQRLGESAMSSPSCAMPPIKAFPRTSGTRRSAWSSFRRSRRPRS